jgi:hypothetical protein
MQRWKRRPEGSNWGDFGPDDQIGRLNLITPEARRRAAMEVKEGLVFVLSLPLDYPRGVSSLEYRKPPRLFSTLGHNCRISPAHRDVACDDGVELALQYSTQWDGLAHIGTLFDADDDGEAEIVYYNGYRAGEHVVGGEQSASGAKALGIEKMAGTGVQGRGVLVNLWAEYGLERVAVGYDALMRLFERQKVVVEPGDIFCLYSGLADIVLDRGDALTTAELNRNCAVLDGHDERLLRWIDESGIAAIASDTLGVEDWGGDAPPQGDLIFPLHHLCLFKLGMPLGELWYFRELATWLKENARTRFLLTAPPLMLPGAVGSPVTAVASV